ncbi:C-C motif chemokine 4-like [Odontesthes bonariensis]|uniref:C-C motif chemokine 4-like n=1 Tax=Odontesthes bonariensis TaxID=219752 RepID=UPI003F58C1E2
MTTTMMKNPVTLLACILIFSSLTVLASDNTFGPDKCCFKFIANRLPKNKVTSYKYTDRLCSMEGVLFTMKRGNEICADATQQWVKDIIEAKDRTKRGTTTTTTGASE